MPPEQRSPSSRRPRGRQPNVSRGVLHPVGLSLCEHDRRRILIRIRLGLMRIIAAPVPTQTGRVRHLRHASSESSSDWPTCGSSKLTSLSNQQLRFTRKRLASSDDDGSVRDAGVRAGVSDRAAPFGSGGGRSSTAACRLQAQTAAPQAESIRSPVLGGHSSDLDQLIRSTHSRQARYGSLLASRRIPPVLDMAIPPAASGAAPERNRNTTWKEFLKRHWELIVAADFFTIEVWTSKGLTRYLVLFFMDLSIRKVAIASIASHANGLWMSQVVRHVTDAVDGIL